MGSLASKCPVMRDELQNKQLGTFAFSRNYTCLVDSLGIVELRTCEPFRNLMQPEKKDWWGEEVFSQDSHPKALQTCDEATRFCHSNIEYEVQ